MRKELKSKVNDLIKEAEKYSAKVDKLLTEFDECLSELFNIKNRLEILYVYVYNIKLRARRLKEELKKECDRHEIL